MQYILLIHADERVWTKYNEEAQSQQMKRPQRWRGQSVCTATPGRSRRS